MEIWLYIRKSYSQAPRMKFSVRWAEDSK